MHLPVYWEIGCRGKVARMIAQECVPEFLYLRNLESSNPKNLLWFPSSLVKSIPLLA